MIKLNSILLTSICIFSTMTLSPKKGSFSGCSKAYKSIKSYTPKAAYSGFGKKSSTTGKIKTKSTHGHFKKSLGYKFVNPYSRS